MTEIKKSYLNRLKNAGYKLTKARLTVLDVLQSEDGHLTSSQVLDAVAAHDPSIGRASVFRTLDLFTQLSIIRPTYIDSSVTPTYVLMLDGHHHHIICTRCNHVIEFQNCNLGRLTEQLERAYGIILTGHLLEFYGVCDRCRQSIPSATAKVESD